MAKSKRKAKVKGNTVLLNINLTDIYSKQVKEFWTSEVETMDLSVAVKEAIKSELWHFKNERDAWPLNADIVAEAIAVNFIGISPMKLAAAALAKVANLHYEDGSWLFVPKRKIAKKRGSK